MTRLQSSRFGHARIGILASKKAKEESPLVLGDGLSEPYHKRVLQMKKSYEASKAKKTYCAPKDDIIPIGTAKKPNRFYESL